MTHRRFFVFMPDGNGYPSDAPHVVAGFYLTFEELAGEPQDVPALPVWEREDFHVGHPYFEGDIRGGAVVCPIETADPDHATLAEARVAIAAWRAAHTEATS